MKFNFNFNEEERATILNVFNKLYEGCMASECNKECPFYEEDEECYSSCNNFCGYRNFFEALNNNSNLNIPSYKI